MLMQALQIDSIKMHFLRYSMNLFNSYFLATLNFLLLNFQYPYLPPLLQAQLAVIPPHPITIRGHGRGHGHGQGQVQPVQQSILGEFIYLLID